MLIQDIFKAAHQQQGSDVHLVVGYRPIVRIDGRLSELKKFKKITAKTAREISQGICDKTQQDFFNIDKELDLSYETPDKVRYRINLHLQKGEVGLSARLIPKNIPTMEWVAMPEIVYELIQRKNGLILVTGASSHGKSTSLAAMINEINKTRAEHIITLEDPIEYLFTPVKSVIEQRELGPDMRSFNQALKRTLRQDPNVIMVGEMRDLESIASTVTLAETGHLVFATLHTFSAAQTIDRIIDMFPPGQQKQISGQLSITLAGIITQKLLPKIGGGRVAVKEILVNNNAIANLIRENKINQINSVIQTSAAEGMITMDKALAEAYKKKLITKETAMAHANNPRVIK
ncbi:MAG TPA: PilT/PilU family type 4a pilus ATPase [Patescibacteria group bacterium]